MNQIVNNYTELAKALKVSRRTLQNWRKLQGAPKPQSNGKHNVIQWENFRMEKHLKGGEISDKAKMDLEKVRMDVELKRQKLDIINGQMIDRELVKERLNKLVSETVQSLERILVSELPARLSGLNESEISAVCKETIGDLLNEFRKNSERLHKK